MAQDEFFIGGIDLGGTKILSVCVDQTLNIVGDDYRETEATEGVEAVVGRMVESMQKAAAGRTLRGVGISTPGPSNPDTGIVSTPPNLPGWQDVPLARLISERLGVSAWIENDANAAAIAEHRLGAGRGSKHLILVTLGTGLGGGLVLNGRIYEGASGAGGEIGHMKLVEEGPLCGCGRHGCFETLVAGRYLGETAEAIVAREPNGILARLAREAGEPPDAKLLEEAADAGDAAADAAIRTAGRYLGQGLANLVNIFNPEIIVVGGSLRKMKARYMDEAIDIVYSEAFRQSSGDVRIVDAELGDESPALGAAIAAFEHLSLPLPG